MLKEKVKLAAGNIKQVSLSKVILLVSFTSIIYVTFLPFPGKMMSKLTFSAERMGDLSAFDGCHSHAHC